MEKLAQQFVKEIHPALKAELNKKNVWQTPFVEKVVISCGVGEYKEDDSAIKKIAEELTAITGQKCKVNKARKAVSAFKLRIGQTVGLTVTLRGEKMYDFIDMLTKVALPRVRDFRGLTLKAFDGHGNYTAGIKDHTIFPEIRQDEKSVSVGFQINIKTTARTDEDAKALLVKLGFPFEKKEKNG